MNLQQFFAVSNLFCLPEKLREWYGVTSLENQKIVDELTPHLLTVRRFIRQRVAGIAADYNQEHIPCLFKQLSAIQTELVKYQEKLAESQQHLAEITAMFHDEEQGLRQELAALEVPSKRDWLRYRSIHRVIIESFERYKEDVVQPQKMELAKKILQLEAAFTNSCQQLQKNIQLAQQAQHELLKYMWPLQRKILILSNEKLLWQYKWSAVRKDLLRLKQLDAKLEFIDWLRKVGGEILIKEVKPLCVEYFAVNAHLNYLRAMLADGPPVLWQESDCELSFAELVKKFRLSFIEVQEASKLAIHSLAFQENKLSIFDGIESILASKGGGFLVFLKSLGRKIAKKEICKYCFSMLEIVFLLRTHLKKPVLK